ncbi:hypothetical protein AVEN_125479-1 [Araneus ventricosus]|uniref:Uncharacterized protein n=1 Tax=Araneus ventricosus TaxID=182803 RepID=A0A4Y2KR84_ARAVE|nr:hypothetical protein AVEN_125479-1 [Araneus ventricosus]
MQQNRMPHFLNSLIPMRLFSSTPFKTGAFWEDTTLIGLAQPEWSFNHAPSAITFPQGARKWAVAGKDNWTPYRAYLRSDLGISPPLKSSR